MLGPPVPETSPGWIGPEDHLPPVSEACPDGDLTDGIHRDGVCCQVLDRGVEERVSESEDPIHRGVLAGEEAEAPRSRSRDDHNRTGVRDQSTAIRLESLSPLGDARDSS